MDVVETTALGADHITVMVANGSGDVRADLRRGEIIAWINDRPFKLCLTLGALVELEQRLGGGSLYELGRNWGRSELTAPQMLAILGAGLRGGGHDVSDDDIARMSVEGGLVSIVRIVDRLMEATFPRGAD